MLARRFITWPFIIAWMLFAISMFPEAYEGFEGWRCAWFVMIVFSDPWADGWGALYYFLFTVPNVLMVLSPFLVTRFFQNRRYLKHAMAVAWGCAAYVVSFAVVANRPTGSSGLQIGYYLWAASFIVFAGEWMRQTLRLNLLNADIQPALKSVKL